MDDGLGHGRSPGVRRRLVGLPLGCLLALTVGCGPVGGSAVTGPAAADSPAAGAPGTVVQQAATARTGPALSDSWHAPAGLPANGTVTSTPFPGVKSGYRARDGYVYLPPAYQAEPRPLLPVLVLMAGQPGSPSEWVEEGGLAQTMDGFAAAHQGLAPIVLVVDPAGSEEGNTLCMDSRITRAQTYLAEDVPDWARANLQTGTGRTAWAIGGVSYGGTCALQLALNAPGVYGSLLDISGQQEPTLGSHQETVEAAFGGDEAAFDAVDPLHVLGRGSFSDTPAAFLAGDGDQEFGPQTRTVYEAALRAGMPAEFQTVPGGHDWDTFRTALADRVEWLARQTRLIP
jgi:S-formylglutathione hydrolase FrmB